jgi:vacuolar-type H+-ATPase subunit I/STV1
MTTDPSTTRATVTSPRQVTQVVSVPSPGAVIGAVLTLVLGLALGIANQGAGGTEMALRVPALLAALLMVGQGVVDIRKHMPRRQVEMAPEVDSGPRGRELAVVRPMPPQPPVTVLATKPSPATLGVPLSVMILAAWLGLADLKVAAPAALSTLSLISAFALFALGWGLLPARR